MLSHLYGLFAGCFLVVRWLSKQHRMVTRPQSQTFPGNHQEHTHVQPSIWIKCCSGQTSCQKSLTGMLHPTGPQQCPNPCKSHSPGQGQPERKPRQRMIQFQMHVGAFVVRCQEGDDCTIDGPPYHPACATAHRNQLGILASPEYLQLLLVDWRRCQPCHFLRHLHLLSLHCPGIPLMGQNCLESALPTTEIKQQQGIYYTLHMEALQKHIISLISVHRISPLIILVHHAHTMTQLR